MTKYHVGIDLHKNVVQFCVLDARGERLGDKRLRIETELERDLMWAWLAHYAKQGRLAVEALGCNRWFVLGCQERGYDILVADATQLDLKRTGKKTDWRDAREIARRLHLGDLDRHARTYFPTPEEYGRRKLERVHHGLSQQGTALAGQIRGLLNAFAIRPPSCDLTTKRSIAWLRQVDLGGDNLAAALDALVTALEALHEQARKLYRRMAAQVRQDPRSAWIVDHVDQAGVQTAFTLVAEFGDPCRFRNARCAASYAGTVPRVTASADVAHHGRMTKRGNRELRYMLGQWAVRLLARNDEVKAWAQPMLRRMHRNKVRMALARRLLVGIWVMLSRGEEFSMAKCLGQVA